MDRIFIRTIFAIFCILSPNFVNAADLSGTARAIDGRTLVISGKTVRLYGIDSPDLKQTCLTKRGNQFPCGKIAYNALATLLRNVKLHCKLTATKAEAAEYEYVTCQAGPMDIAKQHVLQGWAFPDPVSGENYRRAERGAQLLNEGLWKGQFEHPWVWRKQHR